jgi:hypothetical protein
MLSAAQPAVGGRKGVGFPGNGVGFPERVLGTCCAARSPRWSEASLSRARSCSTVSRSVLISAACVSWSLLTRRARNSSGTATQCTRRNDSPPDTGGSMRSPQRPPRLPPPPGRCCQGGRRWSRCRTAAAAADAAGPAAARRHRLRPAAAGARTQRASSPAPPRSRTRTPAPPPACPRDRWQPGRGAVGRYPLVGHFCSLPPPKGMAALQRPHCHLCRHRPPRSGAATSRAGRRRPAAGPVPQRSRGGPW